MSDGTMGGDAKARVRESAWWSVPDAGVRPVTVLVGARGDLAAFVMGDLEDRKLVDRVVALPEQGRHPAGHLAAAEEIVILQRVYQWRVVLHTHSPYVLDHLVTLVTAHALPDDARQRIVPRLALRDARALLDPNDLAVYRVHEDAEAPYGVRLAPIYDPARVCVDPSVFSDVGDAETNLYSDVLMELIELSEAANGGAL